MTHATAHTPFGGKELWAYRELFWFLVWRDVKVRYKQTFFGVAWAVLQPLFTMIVFSIFFGRLARLPSDGIPYPVFTLAALLPWTLFANALASSSNSLVGNQALLLTLLKVTSLPLYIALAIVLLVVSVSTFLLSRGWVFARHRHKP